MDNHIHTPSPPTRGPGAKRPHCIAVASGKGGVGKTWFAITLAHALAQLGDHVALFDGDLGLANIDIQLGLCPENDLAGVMSGRVSLARACIPCEATGFDIVPGRSGSGSMASVPPARLEWLLGELALLPHGRLILDLGAGLDMATRRLAAWADLVLVVATDEPTSLTDAYAVLKLHAGDAPTGSEARIVVNQAASVAAGQRTYATLARACQNFLGHTPKLAGIIRRDDRVRDAIRHQTPLLTRHPSCPAAEDVHTIARRIGALRGICQTGTAFARSIG
jgi:flagellar biosynthesis protein FlhG